MSQKTESIPSKQPSIKNFFLPCKGPLMFQKSTFKSKTKSPKRRPKRLKKKKPIEETDDNDLIIIEDVKEIKVKDELIEVCPLSPQIYFDDELVTSTCSHKNKSDDFNNLVESPSKKIKKSPEQDENCSLNLNNNESIKRKLNFSNSSSQIINIAVTKSHLNVKTDFKLSKTQTNVTLDASLNNSYRSYALNIESLIYEMEENDFGGELDEFDCKEVIKNVLTKIGIIIKNSLRPSYENLLFENEKNLLLSFCSMKIIYQFICCKLFTHQIKWYKPESFIKSLRGRNNLNLGTLDIDEMIKDLEKYNFIQTNYENEDLSYLLGLLKTEDINKISNDLRLNKTLRGKDQKISVILAHINKQPTLNPSKPMNNVIKTMICKKLGKMIKINDTFYNTFYKIHLMYSFTNSQLDIPHGVYKFMGEILSDNLIIPKFKTSEIKIFETAKEFAEFSNAYTYKEALLQEANKKHSNKSAMLQLCEEILTELKIILNQKNIKNTRNGFLNRFTPGNKYASALAFGIEKLSGTFPTRTKVWIEELLNQDLFRIRKKSRLYAQLATIYKKNYKDKEKACEILAEGLKDESLLLSDVCELIYRAKSYMKYKDCRKHFVDVLGLFEKAPNVHLFPTITITGKQKSDQPLFVHTTNSGDREYLRVEDYAIRHYAINTEFKTGIHCEGSLLNKLFFILFWDIIYKEDDSIPIFINSIQTVPLDLNNDDFYTTRKDLIDDRLEKIKFVWSPGELNEHVENIWHIAANCKSVINAFDVEVTIRFIELIGRNVLGKIMERFVKGYDEWRAGLPDLFLWNDVKCKFVEVKGPGDQLSTKQKLWISFLKEIGVDVEVCRVKRLGGT